MSKAGQLRLFTAPAPGLLAIPDTISRALEKGATLVVSVSGGKDSQAMLLKLAAWFRRNDFPGQLVAVHADLGRAEWADTPAFVERICQEADAPLTVVRRPGGDMVARFEQRAAKLVGTDKPFWSSSANRYCTSDMKRGPIDTYLRQFEGVVISAEGLRADESRARADKPVMEVRTQISNGKRTAYNWRPILHWNEDEVWEAIGTTSAALYNRQSMYRRGYHDEALDGWRGHPAYVYGNTRLSCALCVLGSKADLLNGANHNPDLYAHYLKLEREGKATFKAGWSLAQLTVSGRAKELRDEILKQPQ